MIKAGNDCTAPLPVAIVLGRSQMAVKQSAIASLIPDI